MLLPSKYNYFKIKKNTKMLCMFFGYTLFYLTPAGLIKQDKGLVTQGIVNMQLGGNQSHSTHKEHFSRPKPLSHENRKLATIVLGASCLSQRLHAIS